MGSAFRIIDTGVREGRANIAFDPALIELRQQDRLPDTIRFMRFPPTALIGRHQDLSREVNLDYCAEDGVGVVRRVTGGGAIYLDGGLVETAFVGGTLQNWAPDYYLELGDELSGRHSCLGTHHLDAACGRALGHAGAQEQLEGFHRHSEAEGQQDHPLPPTGVTARSASPCARTAPATSPSCATATRPAPGPPAQPSRPPHPSSRRPPTPGYPPVLLHPCAG